MDRRSFLIRIGGAVAGTMTLALLGCSEDDPGPGPMGVDGQVRIDITNNHGHSLVLARGDLVAGQPIQLSMDGGHSHTVDLTAADVDALLAGNTVTKVSSDAGHTHSVEFDG